LFSINFKKVLLFEKGWFAKKFSYFLSKVQTSPSCKKGKKEIKSWASLFHDSLFLLIQKNLSTL